MNETAIFARAILIQDQPTRQAYLSRACGGDSELRRRMEALVCAHENPLSFLEPPSDSPEQSTPNDFEATRPLPTRAWMESGNHVGSTVGPYKLLQQVGEGGMGVVFMAEQTQPVRRRVAIKIIKPGMDSRQVIARFEAERQALAMMDHPNIAKVLDAGTTAQGHPYFVMELVNGLAITEYCDQEKLSPNQRLELFADVCRAVQHAHQKGVIHRDLKPSNILVAEYDGRPVPKIIDFGVAKATGPQLTDKTLFTELGQIIGTLEYMSPEQARRNQLDVDTRSDIYSLGIVLYALLTGETPFGSRRFKEAAWDDMLKIIREEEPQRPSLKIDTSQTLQHVAERRSVSPQRLSSLVRGDLDWIVMKTLEKDRAQRYGSANELADDVTRYLNEQPITARPQTTWSHFAKYVRRNRRTVLVATVATMLMGAFLATQWIQHARRINQMGRRTERLDESLETASLALGSARAAAIHSRHEWAIAATSVDRINDILEDGPVARDSQDRAEAFTKTFEEARSDRELALQIENVLIFGATNPTLQGWEKLERDLRSLFRKNGFNLSAGDPDDIAYRIKNHRSAARWTDALELWIGTRGHMASLGGPRITAREMQPWADCLLAADPHPVRKGVRKFIYEGRFQDSDGLAMLNKIVDGVELKTLRSRTLAWLGVTYAGQSGFDEADRIFEIALRENPGDLMLNFDWALVLEQQDRWQEAIRMYHHCLALRGDVPGLWNRLAMALDKVDETKAAAKARARAAELEGNESAPAPEETP